MKKKTFKKDIILIVSLAAAALILFLVFYFINSSHNKNNLMVKITLDKELYYCGSLYTDKVFEIDNSGNINKVTINNGLVDVYDSNCPDHICDNTAPISSAGQSIICLPHKMVVEIVGEDSLDANINQ